MSATLGGIGIKIFGATPFLYGALITRTPLIGIGEYLAPNNEVIQGSALPNRSAQVSVRIFTEADLESLMAMYASQSPVTFVDRRGASRQVVIEQLDVNEAQWLWEGSMTLVEVSAPAGSELSS